MDRENGCLVIGLIIVSSLTFCFGLAPAPTNVDISCLNFNCTLFWVEPDNSTGSVIMYTVEEEIINENDITNVTFVEIPDCVNVQQTECSLVPIISVDSLSNMMFVVVSAFVNGERSDRVEIAFTPLWKATLSHPDVDLVPPVEPTSFTVHIHAPLTPFVNLKSGELLRVDELPQFKKNGFFTPKFKHSSVLYKQYPNNTLEKMTDESDFNLDKVVVFEDLTPDTTYRLEVTSWIGRGRLVMSPSKEFTLLTVTTPEDEPSEGPVIMDVVRKNPNCSSPDVSPVILSWKPPADETYNGVITHYSIRYMYPGYDFSLATVKNCSVKDNTLELELQRWQAYEFAVFICNSVGCAESDHKTLFNLQAIRRGSKCINVSVDLAQDHPLLISWQPPSNFTECITQYLVGIYLGERPSKKPVKIEMVFTTFLQINETLPPGTYTVVVQSFVRNGFDSVAAGEEASKQFMIEDKTVTNHLVLPLVISLCFIFCAILVAFIICCKWILRPFDFHLEKTRALKIAHAREFQDQPVHYHNTEHEVYDALPGGSRRTSIISFRPSRNSITRLFSRTDSTSSLGNRPGSRKEPPSRLTSHVEQPDEEDDLVENVMYSPISTRKTKKLECSDSQPTLFPEMRPLLSSGGSALSNVYQYPMLTIEIRRDNDSSRVVRWKAGGYEGTDDDDPFDLPKAEDYDEACASETAKGACKSPTGTESDTRTSSSSSDKSSIHSQRNSGIKYSNLPLLNSSSGSPNSQRRLHYASLASQTSESSLSSSVNSQKGLNYACLASQNSESSDAGSVHVINVINPSLFAAVDEEDDNEEESGGAHYSQMGNSQSSADVPNSEVNTNGYIDPYSRMSSSQSAVNGPGVRLASPDTRQDNDGEYHQLARADPAIPAASDCESNDTEYHQLSRGDAQRIPQIREERTDSSVSQSYVQLSNTNSVAPCVSDSPSGANVDSNMAAKTNCSDEPPIESDNSDHSCSSHEKSQPESKTHQSPTDSCTSIPSAKQSNDDRNDAITNMQTDLPQYVNTSNQGVASPHVPRNVGANTQLHGHSPCASPTLSRTRTDSGERGHLYRSVRIPPMHLTPGSPLLPSRALDICNSDSEDSSTNYNSHESLDSIGETHASVSTQSTNHDTQPDATTQNGVTLPPKRHLSCQSESSGADEYSIPEMCVQIVSTSDNEIQEVNYNCDGSLEDDGTKAEVTAPSSESLTNGGYVMRT